MKKVRERRYLFRHPDTGEWFLGPGMLWTNWPALGLRQVACLAGWTDGKVDWAGQTDHLTDFPYREHEVTMRLVFAALLGPTPPSSSGTSPSSTRLSR